MTEPVVQAINVGKVLGTGAAQVQALADVNLALSPGELALLMGPSGSGKTTLLSVLGCMMTPSCGTVRIAGHSIEGLSPEDLAKVRRDHIGFVFQSYHLFPTLTALDNVQLALDVRNERPRIAMSKASEALARVGLAHKRGSYPHELSGGEQQRVAIARAVVASPAVILADEPTAALDGENGQAIMTIIADIARNLGSTVLVVTHDPRLIRFGSRIIHIEDGHIVGEQPGGASPNRHAAERGKDRRGHPFTVVSRRPT